MAIVKLRILTYERLVQLNSLAIRRRANTTLAPKPLAKLDRTTIFPITFAMGHTEDEVRIQLVMDGTGKTALLDIPMSIYNNLPVIEADDGGPVDVEALFEDVNDGK